MPLSVINLLISSNANFHANVTDFQLECVKVVNPLTLAKGVCQTLSFTLRFGFERMPTQHRILALVYNGFETLDLFGPLGAIIPRSSYYTLKLVDIHNQGAPNGIESSIKNGIGTLPNLSLAEALKEEEAEEQFDTLFIPGGLGMIPLISNHTLLQQIGQLVDRAANVFTVCTGSILLAATGRLDGRKSTTNKRLYDEMTPKCTLQVDHHPINFVTFVYI